MSISKDYLLQIHLAVAIALADDKYSESEEKTIKKWFEKEINSGQIYSKELDLELKKTRKLAESNKLDLKLIYLEMNSIEKRFKYKAMDLAIEVMTADCEIHPKEVYLIHEMIEQLNLDNATAKKYILQQILKMKKPPVSVDIEGLLKINPTVSNNHAQKLIQKEFSRWVSAAVTNDEKQKTYAQKMIDIISRIRERYA